jgi:hypothetical protein
VRSAIAHHMRPLNDGDFDQLFGEHRRSLHYPR